MTENDISYEKEERYRGRIEYESILGQHIFKISQYRDKDLKQYASSIETFILMCPLEIRKKGLDKLRNLGLENCNYNSMNEDRMKKYDELWIYVNELLETENLIFKSSYIKTYS